MVGKRPPFISEKWRKSAASATLILLLAFPGPSLSQDPTREWIYYSIHFPSISFPFCGLVFHGHHGDQQQGLGDVDTGSHEEDVNAKGRVAEAGLVQVRGEKFAKRGFFANQNLSNSLVFNILSLFSPHFLETAETATVEKSCSRKIVISIFGTFRIYSFERKRFKFLISEFRERGPGRKLFLK